MAGRKPKEKLDFYNMEDGWIHDYKVRRFAKKTSFAGLGFYCYLMHEAYHNSYFIEDADDFIFSASDYGNVEEEQIVEWLKQMESFDLIKLIDLRGKTIITSKGIQRRYLFIRKYLRRAQEFVPEIEIWLLDDDGNDISATDSRQKFNLCNRNDSDIEFLHTETETERETEKEKKKETETETDQKQKRADADFSDSFQSSFSDSLISRLTKAGVDVKQNTLRKVNEWIAEYDPRSIDEAADVAIAKKAKNIVGYMDTVLKGWAQGSGNPKWIEREEMALAEQKKEYMRPGAMAKDLMTTRKLE